jgi:hypothetical protein
MKKIFVLAVVAVVLFFTFLFHIEGEFKKKMATAVVFEVTEYKTSLHFRKPFFAQEVSRSFDLVFLCYGTRNGCIVENFAEITATGQHLTVSDMVRPIFFKVMEFDSMGNKKWSLLNKYGTPMTGAIDADEIKKDSLLIVVNRGGLNTGLWIVDDTTIQVVVPKTKNEVFVPEWSREVLSGQVFMEEFTGPGKKNPQRFYFPGRSDMDFSADKSDFSGYEKTKEKFPCITYCIGDTAVVKTLHRDFRVIAKNPKCPSVDDNGVITFFSEGRESFISIDGRITTPEGWVPEKTFAYTESSYSIDYCQIDADGRLWLDNNVVPGIKSRKVKVEDGVITFWGDGKEGLIKDGSVIAFDEAMIFDIDSGNGTFCSKKTDASKTAIRSLKDGSILSWR